MTFTSHARIRWSVPLANPIIGGGDCIVPTLGSGEAEHLYIADGWGSSYASMKLRRLSLATGETLATAAVKNTIRALHFHPDQRHIYAAGDKKILVLDAAMLAILDKHDKGLLQYPAHLSSVDAHTLLTADHCQGWLFTYDLATRMGKRRHIAKSCWLLEPVARESTDEAIPRGHYYADGQSGELLRYDPTTGKHHVLWVATPFGSCHINGDCIALQMATYAPNPSSPKFIQASPTTCVQVHCLTKGSLFHVLESPHPFTRLALALDNRYIALWNHRQLSFHDLGAQKQLFAYSVPEKQTLLNVLPAHRLFFTTDTTETPSLHCHEY